MNDSIEDKSFDFVANVTRESKADCDDISTRIKQAHDYCDTSVAIEAISYIWENVDRVAQLAEARSRLLLGKIVPPRLCSAPTWLEEQVAILSESLNGHSSMNSQAIESVKNLICACLIEESGQITAQIVPAPLGHVFVDWDLSPTILQWEVAPTHLPWPGCRVNVVSINNSMSKSKIQSRIFHNSFQVIRHFHEQIALR